MKFYCRFLFTAFLSALFFIAGFAQHTRLSIGKEPAWVTKQNVAYTNTTLDKSAADGYMDIAFEKQICLAEQSRYCRFVKKIISQSGVQNGSEISVSYDPSYEQLVFHSIYIIRNGEKLNRLQLSNIKTVHQEKELSNFIYNGSLDALLVLDDVRQGDIIEYSYTIKGFNPIFKNYYAEEYSMEFSVPVYDIYYKLIVPHGKPLNIKALNETIQPVISSMNGQQVYEWHKSNVLPLAVQDNIPSWYDPYAEILVSSYNSWKEVNDWAMGIFPVKKEFSAALQNKIKEIKARYATAAERAKAALRFVQDDIRYMGIEMGEGSYKPADPSKVFAQRFGDCKEKSYLLCSMLGAMNIEANVVLINTDSKSQLNSLLPDAAAFNHVTTRVKLDNVYYWFDPTISYQRGDVKQLFYPDYQAGLVISDTTTCLTAIAYRNISYQHIKEDFAVTSMDGSGTLVVTTSFKGSDADDTRKRFNDESIKEIMTDNVKFYSRYYEDIKADSLAYNDNDSTGIFTTTEYYTLPDFWKTKDGVKTFSFSSFNIDNILKKPKEKKRTMPFNIDFPLNFHEEITIAVPHEWHVDNAQVHLKNAGFAYNSSFFCRYDHIELIADYQNNKDYVAADEAPGYLKDINTYDESNYEISWDTNASKDSSTTVSKNANIITSIIWGAAFVGIIIYRRTRRR